MGSNSPVVPDPVLGLHLPLRHPAALSRRVAMARDAAVVLRPWLVDLLPLLVVLLIAAHVLALGYWIYRLATDGSRQPARSKKH
ncbi:hypothetical protein E2562_021559 [Oryza meyeriana var. granulata]|uniref:Uncharacterized protein n=1 Tax=Oryza meyeriana var. granulata TaxID=110450 RepID=A0A6G1EXQ4_9ORYZ|nr:hypothetical protein E2562_021559 [Oryza meyeriana var. granulata]